MLQVEFICELFFRGFIESALRGLVFEDWFLEPVPRDWASRKKASMGKERSLPAALTSI